MSNISRRDFLKTAGVMSLAVAASAALAGCQADTTDTSSETVNSTTTSFSMGDTCTFGKAHHTITISTKFYTLKDHMGAFLDEEDVLYAAIKVKVAAGSELLPSLICCRMRMHLAATRAAAALH